MVIRKRKRPDAAARPFFHFFIGISLILVFVVVPGVHFTQLRADLFQLMRSLDTAAGVEVGTAVFVFRDPLGSKGCLLYTSRKHALKG